MRAYQQTNALYLSSLLCSASIYLNYYNGFMPFMQRQPRFLSAEYSVVVDRDSVYLQVPLVKLEAISTNPDTTTDSQWPIVYSIVEASVGDVLRVDSFEGFVYPRFDLALAPQLYSFTVMALDQSNQLTATVNVSIVVTYRSKYRVTCATDYLVIRLTAFGNKRGFILCKLCKKNYLLSSEGS